MLMTAVDTYLAVRRAAGFKLRAMEVYLRSFARFATERGDTYVVAQTVIDWAAATSSGAQQQDRLLAVLRFARFMRAEDPRHELPPKDIFYGRRQRPTPYIFSDEEIQRIVTQAGRLGASHSLRPHVYRTLFGLLAATGMRPSEARRLTFSDLTPDGLTIQKTKFRKSRLLPLHPTTWAALEHYLERRRRVAGHDPYLFVTRRGGPLSYDVLAETFHNVVKAADIPREAGRPRPRLMDFRHTFAVRGLENCPHSRDQAGRHMLALSTYLGHAKIEHTFYYLEQTPELMTDIAHRLEAFMYGDQS